MEDRFGLGVIIGVIIILTIGAIVGWLGSLIYKRSPLGLGGHIFMGIVGTIIGYTLVGVFRINLGTGFIGPLLPGVIGPVVILFLLNLIFKNN